MKFYNVFSGALSGQTREAYVRNIGDRVFNSLHSYWYFMKLSDEKIRDAFKLTKGNIMIDSGAFTAWSKDINLDPDKYLEWINKWDKYVTLFGQIDVIPPKSANRQQVEECCKKTWDNYLYMRERMKSPEKLLYTFHYGEDFKWLKQALEYRDGAGKPIEYMALGGLVGRSTKQRIAFLDKCFNIIQNSSNPNIKVHGFGVSSEKLWRRYPFESCDSFTPGMATNYASEKESWYKFDDYERIFKPRGWSRQVDLDTTRQAEAECKRLERANKRIDDKAKLLIKNIEYWNDLANSINRT